MSILLFNSRILTRRGLTKGNVFIENGRVASLTASPTVPADLTIDVKEKLVIPGFVDVHTHLREPGFFYKESIATATAAAARCGYTALCAMPNLNPVPDSVPHLNEELSIIKRDAAVKVYPYGAITVGERGKEIADLEGMAKDVIAFSDDGRGVQDEGLMTEAMLRAKALGKIIVAHCEDESKIPAGASVHTGAAARFNLIGNPSESEYAQVARDLELVAKTGCRYHICHVSTKESVRLIREAKRSGLAVTAETAPHYLTLNCGDILNEGRFKMNPPLREEEDRLALIEGLTDGTLDMIATDHAPHSAEEKSKGLADSSFGITGLETAFSVLYTRLVKRGILSMAQLVELMSINPRRVFGIEGGTEVGDVADIAVLDEDCYYEINHDDFLSKGKATPFDGQSVWGKNILTILNGRLIWQNK